MAAPKKPAARKPAAKKPAAKKGSKQMPSRPQSSRMRNRFIGLALALLIGASGYTLLWQAVARRLSSNIEQSFILAADQGTRITHDGLSVSGFPYRLVVTLKEPMLQTQSGAVRIRSDRVTGFSHLWTPSHWVFDAATTRITTGLIPDLVAPGLKASWRRLGDTGQRIVIEGATAKSGTRSIENLIVGLALPSAKARAADDDLLGETLAVATLGFAAAGERVDLKARITGDSLLDLSKDSLGKWRDAGGVVEISTLTFDLGPGRRLQGSASLSLDREYHALGTLDLKPLDQSTEAPALLKPLLPKLGGIDRSIAVSLQNGGYFLDGNYVADTKPFFD